MVKNKIGLFLNLLINKKQITISIIVALVASIIICFIALDHNPSGEFYECLEIPGNRNCHINWNNLIRIGSVWFVCVNIIEIIFLGAFKLMHTLNQIILNK